MNIILNSYCNLKCNYCFADEYMEETVRTPGKSMDYDFFMSDLLPKIKTTTSKVYEYSLGNSKEIPGKHLCLPIWFDLEENISDKVIKEIKESLGV